MNELDRLMRGLDTQKPDWWIAFADDQDKMDYLRRTSPLPGTLGHDPEAIKQCTERMRRNTALRLFVVVRAWQEYR